MTRDGQHSSWINSINAPIPAEDRTSSRPTFRKKVRGREVRRFDMGHVTALPASILPRGHVGRRGKCGPPLRCVRLFWRCFLRILEKESGQAVRLPSLWAVRGNALHVFDRQRTKYDVVQTPFLGSPGVESGLDVAMGRNVCGAFMSTETTLKKNQHGHHSFTSRPEHLREPSSWNQSTQYRENATWGPVRCHPGASSCVATFFRILGSD